MTVVERRVGVVLERLTPTCERCDLPLVADRFMLSMTTEDGVRRAYECSCGAVTITVFAER